MKRDDDVLPAAETGQRNVATMVTRKLEVRSRVSNAQAHRAQNTTAVRRATLQACPTAVVAVLVGVALILPVPVTAQEVGRFEISGGYTFLDSSEVVDAFGVGWLAGGAWNTTRWLALGVELNGSGQRQSEGFLDVEASFFSFLAGPRVAASIWRLRPFAQVLGGRSRLELVVSSDFPFSGTGDTTDTYPAVQLGGGVDIPVDGRFSVRVALDYRRVFAPVEVGHRRVLTGLVYGFPSR